MTFSYILTGTAIYFLESFKRSWLLIVGVASIHFFYQYLISALLSDPTTIRTSILIYNMVALPIITLFIMHIIKERVTHKNLLGHIKNIFQESQRCYGRLLMYFIIVTVIKSFLTTGTNFLLFLIIIIKLPFIEPAIYFNNKSLWESVKISFEYTQNNVLKVTLFIAALVIFLSFFFIKSLQIINISTAPKVLSFMLGIMATNLEIIGKAIMISLFITISKSVHSEKISSAK